jgi:hypothetical protein
MEPNPRDIETVETARARWFADFEARLKRIAFLSDLGAPDNTPTPDPWVEEEPA